MLKLPGHVMPWLPTCHSDDHHAYILCHTHTFYFFPTFHLWTRFLHSQKDSKGHTFLCRPMYHLKSCRIGLNKRICLMKYSDSKEQLCHLLLGVWAVWNFGCLPTFQRNMLPPSSVPNWGVLGSSCFIYEISSTPYVSPDDGDNMFLWNFCRRPKY